VTDILQSRLVPSPDAAESAVGDETVILHLKSGIYFGLDAVGTRIWSMLKKGIPPSEICRRIAEEFEVDPKQVEVDAAEFLDDLKANDILVEPASE
jgi:hypothetical protein